MAALHLIIGGFTVYRPWHWSLENTDLYYGDLIGGRPDCIVAYEVDGCDFTITDGLPYPTGKDGAPPNLTIVAMAPAVQHEEDHFNGTLPMMNSVSTPAIADGEKACEGVRHPKYGAGMIATFDRGVGPGDGTMFVAGTTDWVVGLQRRNWFVENHTKRSRSPVRLASNHKVIGLKMAINQLVAERPPLAGYPSAAQRSSSPSLCLYSFLLSWPLSFNQAKTVVSGSLLFGLP